MTTNETIYAVRVHDPRTPNVVNYLTDHGRFDLATYRASKNLDAAVAAHAEWTKAFPECDYEVRFVSLTEDGSNIRFSAPVLPEGMVTYQADLGTVDLGAVDAEPAPEPTVLLAGVPMTAEAVMQMLDAKDKRIAHLDKQVSDVSHDFEHVAEALRDEAEERGWCDDYERFVDKVNRNLRGLALHEREYEYDVTFTISVDVTVTVSGSRNADSWIYEYARGELDVDAICAAVRQGGWSETDADYERA